jgi:hypothetical protein
LKGLGKNSRRFVDEPLSRHAYVLLAEHCLRVVAVHYVVNPHPHAAVPEGLAAAVDLAVVEGGDMVVRLAVFSPTGRPAPSRDPFREA